MWDGFMSSLPTTQFQSTGASWSSQAANWVEVGHSLDVLIKFEDRAKSNWPGFNLRGNFDSIKKISSIFQIVFYVGALDSREISDARFL